MKTRKIFLFLYSIFLLLLLGVSYPKRIEAQTCSGSYTSSGLYECFYDRDVRSFECRTTHSETGPCIGASCQAFIWIAESCTVSTDGQNCAAYNRLDAQTTQGCTLTNPQPSPQPSSTPPAGSCTSGDCIPAIANCGAVGRDPGAGTCAGGLCCVPRSGYVANCPYDVGQTGYPTCRYSEGNGCNAACSPPFGTCSGCADGLVGGGCSCPTCSVTVTPDSTTVVVGQTTDLTFTSSDNFGVGWQFQYTNAGIASVAVVGGVLRVSGIASGSTTVTILGQWSGYSPRTICSKVVSITVTPPPPTGTIQAEAVVVDGDTQTCTEIGASSNLLGNTTFSFTNGPAPLPSPKVYNGTPVVWNNAQAVPPQYFLSATNPDPDYGAPLFCYQNGGNWIAGNPLSLLPNQTLVWRAGFSYLNDWFQVVGGGLKAGGAISEVIPPGNFLVSKETANQNSPVVNYGGNSLLVGTLGGAVSEDNYIVKDPTIGGTNPPTSYNYYTYYATRSEFETKTRLAATVATDPGVGTGLQVYDVADNLTISGPWNVESGKLVVVFVPGDLQINSTISVATGGFLAFIVAGNITVDDTVGDAPTATPNKFNAHLQGVFISQGVFTTVATAGSTDEQLIASGTYVANSFSLNRDLEDGNDLPAEVFMFRPDLWLTAPGALKEIRVVWTEVAP